PVSGGAFWPGWKIARAAVLTSDNSGGLVLDGYGGLHPFGSMTVQPAAAYFGWDIARDVALLPASSIFEAQGYTLDGWGGVHAFGTVNSVTLFPPYVGSSVRDTFRALTLAPQAPLADLAGWTMDGYGGIYPFGRWVPPVRPLGGQWPNWDIAVSLVAQ